MSSLTCAGVFIAHVLCFLPLCAEAKASRFHSFWMAAVPTLALIAYDLSEKSALHGPIAVAVIFLLVVCGVGSFFGWPTILGLASDAQPHGKTSTTGLNLSGLIFVFMIPGASAIAALLVLLWFRWRTFAGFRVFAEPVSFPLTLERDPRIQWASGLFLAAIIGWLLSTLNPADPRAWEIIAAAVGFVVLVPSIFQRRQVVLLADGIEIPKFPTGRQFVAYRDITDAEATLMGVQAAIRTLRIDFYSSSRAFKSAYLGKIVENLPDLATFIKGKSEEARRASSATGEARPSQVESWRDAYDRWTIGFLVAFNVLTVVLPLVMGKGLSTVLVGVLMAIFGQGMVAAMTLFAKSPGARKQWLQVGLVILYFGLFRLTFG